MNIIAAAAAAATTAIITEAAHRPHLTGAVVTVSTRVAVELLPWPENDTDTMRAELFEPIVRVAQTEDDGRTIESEHFAVIIVQDQAQKPVYLVAKIAPGLAHDLPVIIVRAGRAAADLDTIAASAAGISPIWVRHARYMIERYGI